MNASTCKIFISYNHHDFEITSRVKEWLEEKGANVTIDESDMLAGENIQTFIDRSIKDNPFFIPLISENSLRSGWVGVETVTSFFAERLLGTRILPLAIDESFLQLNIEHLTSQLEAQLEDLDNKIMNRLNQKQGSDDLNPERKRIRDLKHHLPDIVARFKSDKTVNIYSQGFETGMNKIWKAIKEGSGQIDEIKGANPPEPHTLLPSYQRRPYPVIAKPIRPGSKQVDAGVYWGLYRIPFTGLYVGDFSFLHRNLVLAEQLLADYQWSLEDGSPLTRRWWFHLVPGKWKKTPHHEKMFFEMVVELEPQCLEICRFLDRQKGQERDQIGLLVEVELEQDLEALSYWPDFGELFAGREHSVVVCIPDERLFRQAEEWAQKQRNEVLKLKGEIGRPLPLVFREEPAPIEDPYRGFGLGTHVVVTDSWQPDPILIWLLHPLLKRKERGYDPYKHCNCPNIAKYVQYLLNRSGDPSIQALNNSKDPDSLLGEVSGMVVVERLLQKLKEAEVQRTEYLPWLKEILIKELFFLTRFFYPHRLLEIIKGLQSVFLSGFGFVLPVLAHRESMDWVMDYWLESLLATAENDTEAKQLVQIFKPHAGKGYTKDLTYGILRMYFRFPKKKVMLDQVLQEVFRDGRGEPVFTDLLKVVREGGSAEVVREFINNYPENSQMMLKAGIRMKTLLEGGGSSRDQIGFWRNVLSMPLNSKFLQDLLSLNLIEHRAIIGLCIAAEWNELWKRSMIRQFIQQCRQIY